MSLHASYLDCPNFMACHLVSRLVFSDKRRFHTMRHLNKLETTSRGQIISRVYEDVVA